MRNKLAGKSKGTSKSAKYFAANAEARKKKNDYNKEYHSTPERVQYREDLNKANRKAKTYGNGDGKDVSHTRKGTLSKEKASSNRARNGKGNNKRLK
jgi:hypothetical protein